MTRSEAEMNPASISAGRGGGSFSRSQGLIVFCSDHGDMMGDHGMMAKGEFHEGSARIPMIARFPKTWENRHRGTECNALVTLGDLLPTFASVAGGEQPETSDGTNIILVLEGQESPREVLLAGQGFSKGKEEAIKWIGITDGQWKYTWYFDDGKEELFHVAEDPGEIRELAREAAAENDYAERCRKFGERIERELKDSHEGRFLKKGKLWKREGYLPKSKEELRGKAFPSFMLDTHPTDARH